MWSHPSQQSFCVMQKTVPFVLADIVTGGCSKHCNAGHEWMGFASQDRFHSFDSKVRRWVENFADFFVEFSQILAANAAPFSRARHSWVEWVLQLVTFLPFLCFFVTKLWWLQVYAAKIVILFPFCSTSQPMVGSLFSLGNECQTENTETWHCLCCDAASFEWVIDVKMPRPKDSYLREKFAKAKSKGKAKVKARTWKIDQESMSNVPLSNNRHESTCEEDQTSSFCCRDPESTWINKVCSWPSQLVVCWFDVLLLIDSASLIFLQSFYVLW